MSMDWMGSDWFWWAFALALFALEALLPGTFMLWLGFAALGTGVVHWLAPGLEPTGQWFVFAVLGLVAVGIGWWLRKFRPSPESDQPLLNRRADQLVGRVFPLESAIVDGRGRLKIGDAYWSTQGPDLPAGTRVRIDAVDGMLLRVVRAD
jgi:membrane protein implicated in regulation of membrane protease activity